MDGWMDLFSRACTDFCVTMYVCVQEYDTGMQKYYNIFSLLSGKEYMVQVRCKPDHGFWSEWTSPVYVQMPECKRK